MDALSLLRDGAASTEERMRSVFAPVTREHAGWRLPGSTANTIAATFFHVYNGQDNLVHRVLLEQPPIFESGGWAERLGVDAKTVWSAPPPDPDLLRAYADEVQAATVPALEALAPGVLDREEETPRGRRTVGARLLLMLVTHKGTHMGEIAALLGCQGLKGFPV